MYIERRKPLSAKVGIFAVGHYTYWDQFPGLLDDLMGYHKRVIDKIAKNDVDILDFGMIDESRKSYKVLPKLKAANIDVLFVDMITYATSSTFGIIVRELDVPIVLVALQPQKAMNYAQATTYMQLCNDNVCSMPEFTGVAVRMGKTAPECIIGTLDDDPIADAEIAEWCRIAHVLHDLKGARIGHCGHVLEAMLDMHSDPTAFTAHFGLHVVQTEMGDLVRLEKSLTDSEVDAKKVEITAMFDAPEGGADKIAGRLREDDLDVAARVAVALDMFAGEYELDGFAYYYEGQPDTDVRRVATNLTVGNSLLTAAGFPMCGESDLKTCIAMLIMDRLEIGGSFAEFHPVDFAEDFVLVGHDGPHHINIAEGKPLLRSLTTYHGKPGHGASVEFNLKVGPITMLGLTSTYDGRFKFVIAEGESVAGLIPATGNTNTRGRFKPDVRTFLKRWFAEGPTHHFALGIGHHAGTLKKIADTLGIEAVVVAE